MQKSKFGILNFSTEKISLLPESVNTCELLAGYLLRREMKESDIPTFEVNGKRVYTKQSYQMLMAEWVDHLNEIAESDTHTALGCIDEIANMLVYSRHMIINMQTRHSLSSKEKEQVYNAMVDKLNSKI
jgi:hypothetical protein